MMPALPGWLSPESAISAPFRSTGKQDRAGLPQYARGRRRGTLHSVSPRVCPFPENAHVQRGTGSVVGPLILVLPRCTEPVSAIFRSLTLFPS